MGLPLGFELGKAAVNEFPRIAQQVAQNDRGVKEQRHRAGDGDPLVELQEGDKGHRHHGAEPHHPRGRDAGVGEGFGEQYARGEDAQQHAGVGVGLSKHQGAYDDVEQAGDEGLQAEYPRGNAVAAAQMAGPAWQPELGERVKGQHSNPQDAKARINRGGLSHPDGKGGHHHDGQVGHPLWLPCLGELALEQASGVFLVEFGGAPSLAKARREPADPGRSGRRERSHRRPSEKSK